MRFSPPASIAGSVFARVKSDAQGSAIRALLGAGAASVIPADMLSGGITDLPARPLLALAILPARTDGARDLHAYRWWVYDDPHQGTVRIDRILAVLPRAYDLEYTAPLSAPASGVQLGGASESRVDSILNLRWRFYDLIILA